MTLKKNRPKNIQFDVISIFPKFFDSFLGESLIKKAREKGLIRVEIHNLRDFAEGKHKKVDDKPFGGGPGMVLQLPPVYQAVEAAKSKIKNQKSKLKRSIILFSTRGKKLNAENARRLSRYDQLILICGRYEGVDERVAKYVADEEISIGDYVLSGGELAAMVLIETVSRFIPGVLGKRESLEEIKGSYPTYTRPEAFKAGHKKWEVPKVLLSGDHKKIQEWRRRQN